MTSNVELHAALDVILARIASAQAGVDVHAVGFAELSARVVEWASRTEDVDAELTARVIDVERRLTILEPPPPPPPPPLPVSPSGEPMPTGDLPGWRMAWFEDFDTDCAEGGFQTAYPTIGVYPTTYLDTSKRGRYDPAILSVSGSVLRKRIHTTPDGVHHVAAIIPELSFTGKWGDVAGGRFAVRFRSDVIPTYKMAWLLWPQSNVSSLDGEIDGPEGNCGGIINGYMHRADPAAQRVFRSTITSATWHTFVVEWIPGVSVAMFIDGVQLGATETVGVPATPMHWVMQTETILNKTIPIDNAAAGFVEIDWLAFWLPAA